MTSPDTPAEIEPENDFDVVVVGAGVAGCITAYQLAQQGHSVVLIERGEAAGSKNLSGGVLYCRGMQEVFPDFLTQAPVERRITRNYINFLNADSSIGDRLQGQPAGRPGQCGDRAAREARRLARREVRRGRRFRHARRSG